MIRFSARGANLLLVNSRVIGEGAFIRDRALSCSQHVHLSMRLDIASVGIGTVRESKYLLFFIKSFILRSDEKANHHNGISLTCSKLMP